MENKELDELIVQLNSFKCNNRELKDQVNLLEENLKDINKRYKELLDYDLIIQEKLLSCSVKCVSLSSQYSYILKFLNRIVEKKRFSFGLLGKIKKEIIKINKKMNDFNNIYYKGKYKKDE